MCRGTMQRAAPGALPPCAILAELWQIHGWGQHVGMTATRGQQRPDLSAE